MQFFDWYNIHKRFALSCGIFIFAIIAAVFLWSGKTAVRPVVSAVAVVAEATRKAETVNYLAEYDEQFSRSVNGVPETYSYKLRETKKGMSWKKETYINDLTLLEAFIRNDSGFFHCVTYPERSCIEHVSSSQKDRISMYDVSLAGLRAWEEKNIFKTTVAQQGILAGTSERLATCATYQFNPDAVSDADMAELMRIIGNPVSASVGSAAALQTWIQQYDVEACFDDETGIVLRYHTVVRQRLFSSADGQMDYASEDTQTITRLRLNPLLPLEEFSTSSVR